MLQLGIEYEGNVVVEKWPDAVSYFQAQVAENEKFWRRIGGRPDFSGKSVIDLGCGHGALAIDMATHGANRVIGLDLSASRIDFAKRYLARNYPKLVDRVEFHCSTIAGLGPSQQVDFVVSKDTFEHIDSIEAVLNEVAQALKPDGILLAGYSPLYFSPYGDHGFYSLGKAMKVPWAHVFAGDAEVVKAYNNWHPGLKCKTVSDLGLNKKTYRDYLDAFQRSPLSIESIRSNESAGGSPLLLLFRWLRRLPGLERYCTVNMYVKLRKSPSSEFLGQSAA